MSKITEISYQKQNKNRCNLYVDGEFFAGISLETVLLHRLKVGTECDKATLENIIIENDKHEALLKATAYVSKTLKTKRQVKDYLIKKGYSEESAYHVIDKLKEYGYVNDQEYSKRYIESVSKSQGKRLIEYKLMMKGVKKEEIENAYAASESDDFSNAKAVAEKHIKNKEKTKENIAKTYRYLIGRGFSYEQANYAVSELSKED